MKKFWLEPWPVSQHAVTLALSLVLGFLPWLCWLLLGFAGGLLVAIFYPMLAVHIGWRLQRSGPRTITREVVECSGASACAFLVPTLMDFSRFYGHPSHATPAVALLDALAGLLGAFLIAASFISAGAAWRHAKSNIS